MVCLNESWAPQFKIQIVGRGYFVLSLYPGSFHKQLKVDWHVALNVSLSALHFNRCGLLVSICIWVSCLIHDYLLIKWL